MEPAGGSITLLLPLRISKRVMGLLSWGKGFNTAIFAILSPLYKCNPYTLIGKHIHLLGAGDNRRATGAWPVKAGGICTRWQVQHIGGLITDKLRINALIVNNIGVTLFEFL